MDILWLCHDPQFVFKGAEDMVSDCCDDWFPIRGFFIGEALAPAVCALAGLVVRFVLYSNQKALDSLRLHALK